mgnify:CR=1 FL=1
MSFIRVYRDWDEIEDDLVAGGFEFIGYTWLPDQHRVQPDEELWLNREKGLFLWVNHIDVVAMLYLRVAMEPPRVKWERLNCPDDTPAVYVSDDKHQRWIKIEWSYGSIEYYRKCIEVDDFTEDGVPVQCSERDIRELERWWAIKNEHD